MREEGFEPSQALSYVGLNDARLTTAAFPRMGTKFPLRTPPLMKGLMNPILLVYSTRSPF